MKRKILITFSTLCLLLGGAFLLRNQFVEMGMKTFLRKNFSGCYSYKKISSEKQKISIENFCIKQDDAEIVFDRFQMNVDFKEIFFHPKLLFKKMDPHWSSYLASFKQYGIGLDVDHGVLTLNSERYDFEFKKGEKKHEIGTLNVFNDVSSETYPFLVTQFHMRGDQLIAQAKVDEVETKRLLPLAAFIFPKQLNHVSTQEGKIALHFSVIFEKGGKIDEISARFSTENLKFQAQNMELAVGLDSLSCEFNYPEGICDPTLPIWKQVDCNLKLDNGKILGPHQLALTDLCGSLGLNPREDPQFNFVGNLFGKEKPLALKLKGKGAIHDDHAYWLEFLLNLDDKAGTPCDLCLSICSPEEESLVCQFEASNLLAAQAEMLKCYFSKFSPRLNDWQIKEGVFKGKLIALFEKKDLSHFELQDLSCENILVANGEEFFRFSKLTGEGRLFDQLNFEMKLPVSHFFGFVSKELRTVYENYSPKDVARLAMSLQFNEKMIDTSASIHFLRQNQSLQFGYTSNELFPKQLEEIKTGWIRSQHITHELYGPIVLMLDEHLKVFGDLDLVGSFDGKELDLAIQADQFLTKHPLLDLKASSIGNKEQTTGRIRLIFNPFDHSYKGVLPLKDAQGYDRRFGLCFEGLSGTIEFFPSLVQGKIADGQLLFDQTPLLRNTHFDFTIQEETAIENLAGICDFSTDKEFLLRVAKLTPQVCELSLFDGKKQCFEFKGTKDENWRGSLYLDQFKTDLQVDFGYDLKTNLIKLNALGEDFSLKCSKIGQRVEIEHIQFKELQGNGVFSSHEGEFALRSDDLEVKGSGNFTIDLPTTDQNFGIRSSLLIESKFLDTVFKTTHPLQFALIPSQGFLLSDVELSGNENIIKCDHTEHFFELKKTFVHHASFDFSKELIKRLVDAHKLPHVIENLKISKGAMNLELGAEGAVIHGAIETALGSVPAQLNSDQGDFHLFLGEGNSLEIAAQWDGNDLQFNTIKGELGQFKGQLKKHSQEGLKGHVDIDLSTIDQIFDLPLNHFLSVWKTGGGYQFEGNFIFGKDLSDTRFKGKIKGDHFEYGGYQLRFLEAKVEIEPGQIIIENLDVTDDAGKIWIGEGALMHRGPNWIFSFPLVEIRGFQPSFLRKIDGPENRINPFVIKSATLSDVRGKLDDLKSINATGTLRFTNLSKKGEKLTPKNLPNSVLRQLGLDGALFVPAYGEVDYAIQNGRCYFREIRSMFSEKSRSEFAPPRNGVIGYFDFDGKVYVDLQLKQKTSRGVSVPISMKVRGKWDDPEIDIK